MSFEARAYQLGEHASLTRQVLKEIQACWPGMLSDSEADLLISSNLDEDLNLVRKESKYSHYYKPGEKLKMRRADSMVRIDRIESQIGAILGIERDLRRRQVLNLVGHAIHHIQDMSVPAHIIPVTHAMTDGFEKMKLETELNLGLKCSELADAASADLSKILFETASVSYQRVLHLKIQSSLGFFSGVDFWSPQNANLFGRYGRLGNQFGETQLKTDSGQALVSVTEYEAFKKEQLRLSVWSSVRAVLGTLASVPGLFGALDLEIPLSKH